MVPSQNRAGLSILRTRRNRARKGLGLIDSPCRTTRSPCFTAMVGMPSLADRGLNAPPARGGSLREIRLALRGVHCQQPRLPTPARFALLLELQCGGLRRLGVGHGALSHDEHAQLGLAHLRSQAVRCSGVSWRSRRTPLAELIGFTRVSLLPAWASMARETSHPTVGAAAVLASSSPPAPWCGAASAGGAAPGRAVHHLTASRGARTVKGAAAGPPVSSTPAGQLASSATSTHTGPPMPCLAHATGARVCRGRSVRSRNRHWVRSHCHHAGRNASPHRHGASWKPAPSPHGPPPRWQAARGRDRSAAARHHRPAAPAVGHPRWLAVLRVGDDRQWRVCGQQKARARVGITSLKFTADTPAGESLTAINASMIWLVITSCCQLLCPPELGKEPPAAVLDPEKDADGLRT